jgi:hypothetical protein
MSDARADLWKETVKDSAGPGKRGTPFDYSLTYLYYRALLQMPGLKPWALFALFVLVFPTSNAISERGSFPASNGRCSF